MQSLVGGTRISVIPYIYEKLLVGSKGLGRWLFSAEKLMACVLQPAGCVMRA